MRATGDRLGRTAGEEQPRRRRDPRHALGAIPGAIDRGIIGGDDLHRGAGRAQVGGVTGDEAAGGIAGPARVRRRDEPDHHGRATSYAAIDGAATSTSAPALARGGLWA
jgi:hypothetical protein